MNDMVSENDALLQQRLLARLAAGPSMQDIREVQRRPDALGDLAATVEEIQTVELAKLRIIVGFDTNSLKRYREERLELDEVVTQIGDQVKVIIPGQSYVEYYNNHEAFSKTQLEQLTSRLSAFSKDLDGPLLELNRRGIIAAEDLHSLAASVSDFKERYNPGSTRDNINRTLEVLASLIDAGVEVPFCDRQLFSDVANIRLATKTPPGWADVKSKGSQALGDFYCWTEFLLGLLQSQEVASTDDAKRLAIFVSGDRKSDWNMSDFAHPYLAAECLSATGFRLSKLEPHELRKVLKVISELDIGSP
ncbi:hypothetical protein GOACH_15_00590 [Gordonia aichiensis NBRC 108223]|uniref:PIN like domain-containing protein n=2 Tax=Gordonia aichiensis TaxID=36820 RepID=L7KNP4_9ACTN|nr:hypothetical protein GOACH_15_00590 [Gordonia aichiensis NBRC 108223]